MPTLLFDSLVKTSDSVKGPFEPMTGWVGEIRVRWLAVSMDIYSSGQIQSISVSVYSLMILPSLSLCCIDRKENVFEEDLLISATRAIST